MGQKVILKNNPPRLAVLVSGGGTTLDNLIKCIDNKTLNAEIACAIASNQKSYETVSRRHSQLAVHLTARSEYDNVIDFSSAIFKQIRSTDADLVCLAGFLSLLEIPDDFKHRVINIHPALLPAFGGAGMFGKHVHSAVIDAGCKVSGCTVHFADQSYDTGQIIVQRCCSVHETDSANDLAARVFEQECIAYPQALNLLAEGKVFIDGKRAVIEE